MNTPRRSFLGLATAAGASALLAGCYVVPARPYYYDNGYEYGPVVTVAPPAPEVEVVGVAPYPGAVWIGGYWNWVGGRHVWVRGRWEAGRPGYRYEPHMWRREGNGWREAPGRWVK
jgi:hypothetical protein